MGAEMGVGRVAVEAPSVLADRGNRRSGVDELGVIRARPMGEISMRALREDGMGGVLPDLLLAELDFLDCTWAAGCSAAGMTRGAS